MGNLQICNAQSYQEQYENQQNGKKQKINQPSQSYFDCGKSVLSGASFDYDKSQMENLPQIEQDRTESYFKRVLYWNTLVNSSKMSEKDREKEKQKQSLDKLDQQIYEEMQFAHSKIDALLVKTYRKNEKDIKNQQNYFMNVIQQGPPQKIRWNGWKLQLFNKSKIYDLIIYEQLLNLKNLQQESQILKDVQRTFPEQKYFSAEDEQLKKAKGQGYVKLKNILTAISNYFPTIGYSQGMNFIVAFLIIVSQGNEIESFFGFLQLLEKPDYLFLGLFEDHLPLLKFLNYVCEEQMKTKYEKINYEDEILSMKDEFQVMDFIQNTNDDMLINPSSPYYVDVKKLIKNVEKFTPSSKQVQNYAHQYLNINQKPNDYVQVFKFYPDHIAFNDQTLKLIEKRKKDIQTNSYLEIIQQ
ncbi:Rab-GTPase-TBC domain [Pseudocohnilembus persalinus]|uniref:Rab-GTPase-TBC domain n=1 Tax=Pseudocohnilembus persalinus TaxID=266149 RepID=A0A0V0R1W5_PSEPJ|nr:Rab-GTPase-TBC domain [Pseudocohnilembus persalinus]|eukprot:KRX08518.1 Rab-GTPase-TBC domain [Pseudocohnilembus persalinus]